MYYVGYTGCSLNIVYFSENFRKDVDEGGVAVNCEKTQFFLNTLYVSYEHGCFEIFYDS